MCSWAGWLVVVTGVCQVCCLWGFGDVLCMYKWLWGVWEEGALEELVDAVGVLCPQGSEL